MYISITASKYVFTLTESNNNISVEFTWLSQPKNTVPLTNEILKSMIDHIGTSIYSKKILSFTELRQGEQIYCTDVNYQNQGSWNDNVIIAWESNKN